MLNSTPGETYLRSRGIAAWPHTIRFAERTPLWVDRETGEVGPLLPAVVGLVQDADDALTEVQRTFIRSDGTGKALVKRAKKSLGRISGGAMRLIVDNRKPIAKFTHLANSAGACIYPWAEQSDADRLSSLLLSGWSAVLRDGVSPEMVCAALSAVPEYRKWAARELHGTRHWVGLPDYDELARVSADGWPSPPR